MQAQHSAGYVGREGPLELVRFASAKNCAKGRSKEALQINRDLDNIKAQIITISIYVTVRLLSRQRWFAARRLRRFACKELLSGIRQRVVTFCPTPK